MPTELASNLPIISILTFGLPSTFGLEYEKEPRVSPAIDARALIRLVLLEIQKNAERSSKIYQDILSFLFNLS